MNQKANDTESASALIDGAPGESIDALFAQAEMIAQEIATDQPLPPELAAPALLNAAPLPPPIAAQEPAEVVEAHDPLQAVAAVETRVNELKDLLHDPDANAADPGDTTVAPAPPAETPRTRPKKGAKFDLSGLSAENPPAPAPVPAVEAPSNTAPPSDSEPSTETPLEAPSPEKSPPKKNRIKSAIASMVSRSKAAMKAVMAMGLNSMVFVLSIFDWPFRSCSQRMKRVIGLFGIVSLLMGLLSLMLPGMMHSNPFEHMETGIATEGAAHAGGAAAGEHGEAEGGHEAAEGGHGDAPAKAEAPADHGGGHH